VTGPENRLPGEPDPKDVAGVCADPVRRG
jgi:hypothetical protein